MTNTLQIGGEIDTVHSINAKDKDHVLDEQDRKAINDTVAEALAFQHRGQLADAERLFRVVRAADPDNFPALYSLGVILVNRGSHSEALPYIDAAARVNPNFESVWHVRDVALRAIRPYEEALAKARSGTLDLMELIAADQQLTGAKQIDQVIRLYQEWIKNTKSPLVYAGYFNLGVKLSHVKNDREAEQAYRHAILIKPDLISAHFNLGTLLERQGNIKEALAQWRLILNFGDDVLSVDKALHILTLNNLGRLLEVGREFQDAEHMLELSLRLNPEQPDVILHWVHLRQKQCEWPLFSNLAGLSKENILEAASAITMLSITDDPEIQLDTARRLSKKKITVEVDKSLAPEQGYNHKKLRVGYLSSDFCMHPLSMLTVELFELHDRENIEVYGFCWTPEKHFFVGDLRERVIKAMDHFVRIADMSDEEAAQCIRGHEIDILVDLQGWTSGIRPNILAYRPAPIQMTYLGFPGTTAMPNIDYVISDKFLIPEELRPFFTEKPLYMPHVYQVSDRKRKIGIKPSRAGCNLPENAFVFCSFNNNYKFTEEIFNCWMRILMRVPNSVLWLLADNRWAQENMCKEARRHGVAAERLVFGSRVPPADYLARYQIADLFLDTFPFNAGTTANDALWMGLPLLTLTGRTFASRMAGSLLNSLGFSELITYALNEYEDMAVSLAQSPERLAAIKLQLQEKRTACQLFDTPRFVSELESLFQQIAKKSS